MAKYLDDTGLAHLWEKLKEKLAGKQDNLTGTAGEVVGFDASGRPVAQKSPISEAERDAWNAKGNMSNAVYDPQNKAQDIYAYCDNTVSAAIGAAIQDDY